MCAVVGYIGKGISRDIIIEGLSRLEYRGYDSSGFACLNATCSEILYVKTTGALDRLLQELKNNPIDGPVGIGHTRWSTHGVSSELNAHPHFDCYTCISVVHNGIIENHKDLKEQLTAQGHTFISGTDTEVIAHLLEQILDTEKSLYGALFKLVQLLQGAFTFIALLKQHPHTMVVVRKKSPLCIGISTEGVYIASDPVAFAGKADKILFLPDESFGFISCTDIQLYNFQGYALSTQFYDMVLSWSGEDKAGYDHFMLKEIYEQKGAIQKTVDSLQGLTSDIWDHLHISPSIAKRIKKIHLIGCGTSWHAAFIAQFFFESICQISTHVHVASEFRYMPFFPEDDTLYILISQSGETADTLEALNMIQKYNRVTIGLTNVISSTLAREVTGFLLTQAGIEVAVASTKAFTTQLVTLYWLAQRIAREKEIYPGVEMDQVCADLYSASCILDESMQQNYSAIIMLAQTYAWYSHWIFIGRHISYPFALEAALKLKEIAYIFAQSYPAGELKHGPLALIDSQTPVVVCSHQDDVIYQKLLSSAQEVKARQGQLISIVFENQKELIAISDAVLIVPCTPLLLGPLVMSGIMQLFVYYLAKTRGCAIDKPRNLAKSVTVE